MIRGPSAFISHADEDAAVADDLCRHLEDAGVPCWIAPRDVTPGQDYASEIVDGIESCSAFVLVLSAAANRSPFVAREVERAASKHKPMYPVRIEDVLPQRALEFFVSSSHWIDALDAPRDAHWARIARAIKGEREHAGGAPHGRSTARAGRMRPGRRNALLALGALGVAIAAGVGLVGRGRDADTGGPPPVAAGPAPAAPALPPVARSPALGVLERAEQLAQRRLEETPHASRISGAPAADTDPPNLAPCPEHFSVDPDLPAPFTCVCSADDAHDGTVWGSDIYTSDSDLCRAALHAGAVGAGGGVVTVERAPGRDLYVGTRRHGVRTHDYGRYPTSIRFAGAAEPAAEEPCPERLSINPDLETPFSCVCSAEAVRNGTVWGSDVYTSDSSICRAALHAGAVAATGGTVTVERAPGRDLYVGTRRHGVRTHDYGRDRASIHFAGAPEPPVPEPCPERLSINPDLATPFACDCSADAVADGTVWGTDIYTSDSSICRAALHAGRLTSAGGTVTIDYLDGRDRYAGSRRNGVGSHDYGAHPASIAFR